MLVRDFVKSQIGRVADHDAKGSPHLPLHDKSAPDLGWSALGSVDGDGSRFRSDAQSQSEASDKHVPPGVDKALPETCQCGEQTGDENGASTTEPVVERNGKPTAYHSAA